MDLMVYNLKKKALAIKPNYLQFGPKSKTIDLLEPKNKRDTLVTLNKL